MTNPKTATPRTGRPRKGSLELRGNSWRARLTVTIDGESVRRWVDLGTPNRAVAKRKLARLMAERSAPSLEAMAETARRSETYSELAARVQKLREADDRKDAKGEQQREALHIIPEIGAREITAITTEDIESILVAARDAGRAEGTLRHLRAILQSRFRLAWKEKLITENPMDRVTMPRAKKDKRERAVLTDAELDTYLRWSHPDELLQPAVRERQTMAVLSRCFGGLRTGDMHALTWEAFDLPTVGEEGFTFGWAPRKKTSRPQKLTIPGTLRPHLRDWWERQGRPNSGLVFPALRGDRAGEGEKKHVSHASAFRRDLRRAFGLEVPLTHVRLEKGGSARVVIDGWGAAPGRKLTHRERELFETTAHTKPVDFHSWRRAFVQALASVGVNAQSAMNLAGHSTSGAHDRYLLNTAKAQEVPAAALPAISVRSFAANDAEPFAPGPAETRKLAVGAEHELAGVSVVESRGIEPLTSALPVRRSPS